MKNSAIKICLVILSLFIDKIALSQHIITFCGEPVPMQQQFVQDKLMNVIKRQVNVVNLPSLRQRANMYMPVVERYLAAYGLHSDLKYLPIVESGFLTKAESGVGAKGIWQIMPATARGYGLAIGNGVDERENFDKATRLACQLIRDNYNGLLKLAGTVNWPIAIAAYNFGIGNILNAVRTQGSNYFTIKLNPETGLYVYKIIAVKELFEYPELYNSRFGYNIFSSTAKPKKQAKPQDLEVTNDASIIDQIESEIVKNKDKKAPVIKEEYVMAHINGKIKKFKDGDIVTIVLDDDLKTSNYGLSFKDYSFGVQGWIIDDRVYFKLGFGHDVTLLDLEKNKGIPLVSLIANKRIDVLLKNLVYQK